MSAENFIYEYDNYILQIIFLSYIFFYLQIEIFMKKNNIQIRKDKMQSYTEEEKTFLQMCGFAF